MKKNIIVIFLFLCLFLPIPVNASDYGIENFYVLASVLENGDLYVREAFAMNGTFNGMDRDINFQNLLAPTFTGDLSSFEGSDIYNGTAIELVQIRAIPYTNSVSFTEMETSGTLFRKVNSASSGDFGVYTETKNSNGVSYRIYNPSSKKCFFYLEYILKDMAIMHEDIAEIGWNIFNDNFRESIHHFKADIFLPGNSELLRAWAHGPLVGNIELEDQFHITLTVDDLHENTAIDTRFLFDKSYLTSALKKTHVNAFDSIIEVETKWAEEANQLREAARKEQEKREKFENIMRVFMSGISGLWTVGIIILFLYVYNKHDKEYESTFKTKYFRDLPADYPPSTVGYLFHRNITTADLSACLLNLINQKIVTFEKLDKNDYKLVYHETENLSEMDKKLVKLLFKEPEITLKQLKKKAKSGYTSFINHYDAWKLEALKEAQKENFYESKNGIKIKASLYAFLGIGIAIITMPFVLFLGILMLMISLVSFIYFLSFTKKTPKGNEHYLKWKALKKFMEDFGTINKKELPEIVLWEKYLVYAVSLGCADKLAKTMELRISEFNDADFVNVHYNVHIMRDMLLFNRIISSSVNTAVNSAYSARSIANSSHSSGGGFGGGFSGGGGSFGGGSGGGRF